MNQVIVAVGSNIEPEQNIAQSAHILAQEQGLKGQSKLIWTKPEGYTEQDDFLNGAFLLTTELNEAELRAYLKELELRLNRIKGPIKAGPRTLDLDIIIWNGRVLDADFYDKSYIRQPVLELLERYGVSVHSKQF